jgi:TetR/AcrR family transcriptional repressor of bet genes
MKTEDAVVALRRRELVSAAAGVIARRGYAKSRLIDVADEAGVSGLLQHYFRSRERLMREAFALVWFQQIEDLETILHGSGSARDRLVAMLDWTFPENQREALAEWSLTLEYWTEATRDPELREESTAIYRRWHTALRTFFEEGRAAGEFSPRVSLDDAADGSLALIEGLMIRVLLRHPDVTIASARETVRSHLAAALGFD